MFVRKIYTRAAKLPAVAD